MIPADRFAAIDTGGNSQIERTEYLKTGISRFRATDVDGNSGISLSEYRALAR